MSRSVGRVVWQDEGRRVIVCDDAAAVAAAAADMFARLAAEAAADAPGDAPADARAAGKPRGRFRVALAGGLTPAQAYRLLATEPRRSTIPWKAIDFFWGDERWVPPDHPDSNYRMVREALLDHIPVPPANVHPMRAGHGNPAAAAAAYERELLATFGAAPGEVPHFDLVMLGMGADGHTASLFPGTSALAEMERLVAANFVPAQGAWRLTLTYPVLNQAAQVVFLVTGAEKGPALRAVIADPSENDNMEQTEDAIINEPWPARLVRPLRGEVTWLLDSTAWAACAISSRLGAS